MLSIITINLFVEFKNCLGSGVVGAQVCVNASGGGCDYRSGE